MWEYIASGSQIDLHLHHHCLNSIYTLHPSLQSGHQLRIPSSF